MLVILNRFINQKSSKISSAAFTVAFFGLLSRVLGLFRDRILAGHFGAGQSLDIYYAAFKIPDLLYSFLIAGSISAAFLPVFHEYLMRDKKEAWRISNLTLNILFLLLVILSVLLVVFAPQLVYFVAPGFSASDLALTVSMSRLMFLSTIFLGISSLISALLQAFSRFLITSLAPIFYNLGIISGILFLTPHFGVQGLAYGVIIGAVFHFLVQLPALFGIGFSWQPILDLKDEGIKKIARLWMPTLSLAVLQLNSIVITAMASLLAVGSIAIFNLADNLRWAPIGIVGVAFSTATFPAMSLAFAKGDTTLFLKRFSLAVRQAIFVALPVTFMIFILRIQIVEVILGTGKFNFEDVRLTATALAIFSLGIVAATLLPLFTRAFFALKNTKTPVFINVSSMVINIILSFSLVFIFIKLPIFNYAFNKFLGVNSALGAAIVGLPLSVVIASIINLGWHWFDLKKQAGDFGIREIKMSFVKIATATLVSAGFVYFSRNVLALADINFFWQGLIAFLLGAGVYLIIARLLRCKEMSNWRSASEPEFRIGDTLDDQY